MKVLVVTLSAILLSITSFAQSVPPDTASTDPANPNPLFVSAEINFEDYYLPEKKGTNIHSIQNIRAENAHQQYFYFSAQMPAGSDLDFHFSVPTGVITGIAAYYNNGTDLLYIDHIESPRTSDVLRLSNTQVPAGANITLKTWFSKDMSGKTLSLSAVKRPQN